MPSRIAVVLLACALVAGCVRFRSDDGTDGGADASGTTDLCGNGKLDPGEYCDDGKKNGRYGMCGTSCLALGPHCGDLEVNGPEVCDDGNTDDEFGDCLGDCSAQVETGFGGVDGSGGEGGAGGSGVDSCPEGWECGQSGMCSPIDDPGLFYCDVRLPDLFDPECAAIGGKCLPAPNPYLGVFCVIWC